MVSERGYYVLVIVDWRTKDTEWWQNLKEFMASTKMSSYIIDDFNLNLNLKSPVAHLKIYRLVSLILI